VPERGSPETTMIGCFAATFLLLTEKSLFILLDAKILFCDLLIDVTQRVRRTTRGNGSQKRANLLLVLPSLTKVRRTAQLDLLNVLEQNTCAKI
jgi:hypothetical protein